jgi:hypothetical protein
MHRRSPVAGACGVGEGHPLIREAERNGARPLWGREGEPANASNQAVRGFDLGSHQATPIGALIRLETRVWAALSRSTQITVQACLQANGILHAYGGGSPASTEQRRPA